MELKDIRTRNDFIEFLKQWDEIDISYDLPEEVADWFIAIQEAKSAFEGYSTKDMAHLFMGGMVGIKQDPDQYHENWWRTIWEEVDYARREGDDIENDIADDMEAKQITYLWNMLRNHFGMVGS